MHSCPEDDEIERPRNMMEMVNGDDAWKEIGLRIKWTEPSLPSDFNVTLGQPLRLRVCVEAKKDVSDSGDEISAFCWTNVRFAENTCGLWKDIKLFENPKCRCENPAGVISHVFQGSLAPARDDVYRITFNVKWKQFMVWANYFQVDTLVFVSQNFTDDGQIPLSVPVNFPCDHNLEHGDTRDLSMPDPTKGSVPAVPAPYFSPKAQVSDTRHIAAEEKKASTVEITEIIEGDDTIAVHDVEADDEAMVESYVEEGNEEIPAQDVEAGSEEMAAQDVESGNEEMAAQNVEASDEGMAEQDVEAADEAMAVQDVEAGDDAVAELGVEAPMAQETLPDNTENTEVTGDDHPGNESEAYEAAAIKLTEALKSMFAEVAGGSSR
ncbi:hypothetical protein RRG08_023611 [Elysia crispata]|uniref:Uncharacterized protein n=1 Tax=Elysia crispata TaxID=231223 RepID=A0AAE0XSP2_9GAST|nr:hypothetical protein RRG08_023611 [Elysia crispata]